MHNFRHYTDCFSSVSRHNRWHFPINTGHFAAYGLHGNQAPTKNLAGSKIEKPTHLYFSLNTNRTD
jgi:hypothetical protein